MKIIDGRRISKDIFQNYKKIIEKNRLKIEMSVILVGNNKVSLSYISQKKRACNTVGISFSLYKFPETIKEVDLIREVSLISKNSSGLIVQLPLPKKINTQKVLDSVPQKKDIDLLSTLSLGKFYSGDFLILPPVVSAISQIIKKEKLKIKGVYVVIIGSGKLVGKPLMIWLASQGATISVLNKKTKNISEFTKRADIIISGAGKVNLIKGDMIKRGAILIDAGSSIEKGSIKGDVHIESVKKRAGLVSLVPGGIGPITTACLIKNLVEQSSVEDRDQSNR